MSCVGDSALFSWFGCKILPFWVNYVSILLFDFPRKSEQRAARLMNHRSIDA